jgi:hypothetical protein
MELSLRGVGDVTCGAGMYAVYSDAQGHYDPTVTPVCKSCSTQQSDPIFPNGCPTGFTLTPYSGPLGGCTEYACKNAAGQGPIMATQATCGPITPMGMILLAAGVAGILFDQMLLGILAIGAGLVTEFGSHMQAKVDPTTGNVTCQSAVTSW